LRIARELKRLNAWLSQVKVEDRSFWNIIGFTVIIYLFFVFFLGSPSFLSELFAGVLGILIGFGLDRRIDARKDERDKKELLRDLRDELEETKRKIFPQTESVLMLYPEAWDSATSSGRIRVLNSEQVRKLSTVYRDIKGTQYEAEWVRRAVEEFNNVPETEKERRKWLEKRYNDLWARQLKRGKELSTEIEEILKEKWWSS
jgi:hypothetical protein